MGIIIIRWKFKRYSDNSRSRLALSSATPKITHPTPRSKPNSRRRLRSVRPKVPVREISLALKTNWLRPCRCCPTPRQIENSLEELQSQMAEHEGNEAVEASEEWTA